VSPTHKLERTIYRLQIKSNSSKKSPIFQKKNSLSHHQKTKKIDSVFQNPTTIDSRRKWNKSKRASHNLWQRQIGQRE